MKKMSVISAEAGWDHWIRTSELPSWPAGFVNPATTDAVIVCGQRVDTTPCQVTPSTVSLHIYASEVGITHPAQGQTCQKCTDQGGEAEEPDGYAQRSEGSLASSNEQLRNSQETLDICRVVICGFQHT